MTEITTYYRGYRLSPSTDKIAIFDGSELIEVVSTKVEAEAIIDGWHNAR